MDRGAVCEASLDAAPIVSGCESEPAAPLSNWGVRQVSTVLPLTEIFDASIAELLLTVVVSIVSVPLNDDRSFKNPAMLKTLPAALALDNPNKANATTSCAVLPVRIHSRSFMTPPCAVRSNTGLQNLAAM